MTTNNNTFFRSSNIFFWVSAALIIRICILTFFLHAAKQAFPEKSIGFVGLKQNDYEYFLGTVDQYFEKGMFQYEFSPGKPFAGRMPGYSAPYMLFRFLVSSKETALFLLFSLQILLGAISVYLISRIAEKIFQSSKAFLYSFILLAVSAHTAIFDVYSLSESFSVSAICFFLYYIFKYFEERKAVYLLLSGFFITWAFFLRPFLGTLLILFPLALILYERKNLSVSKFITTCFLFFIPFVICESAWIYRNFVVMKKFIPLETSLSESYGEMGAYRTSAISIRHLIQAWGGVDMEFEGGSEANWFHVTPLAQANDYIFPTFAFNASFNKDSLIQLKKIFNASVDTSLTAVERDSLNMLASAIALRYTDDYRSKNMFRYYFINPVKRFYRLLFTNTTGMLPMTPFNQMNLLQKMVKLFYFSLYLFVTIAGTIGMTLFFFSQKKLTAPAFILVIFPWLVALTLNMYGVSGFRYFVNTYPVFIVFMVFLIITIINRYGNKKILTA
ncbi:MAG: glycosyltransferase family 39 protein [Bacteroidia bacterium]